MASFTRNILTLSAGNLIAQVISVGLMPVITRMYAPEDFGVFALYLSVVMVIFPVATLRFNSAIMLPEQERDAAGLLLLSWLSVFVVALILIPVAIGVMIQFGWTGGNLGLYVWLIPVGVAILGCKQAAIFWMLRKKEYKRMSQAAISESVADRGAVLGFATIIGSAPHGLMIGRLIGPFVSLFLIVRTTILPDLALLKGAAKSQRLAALARRYKDFPLFSSWAFLANALGRELPTILLAVLFSPVAAGFYGLGMRVMNMPMMLIGDAVAKVFFQKASTQKDDLDGLRGFILDLIVYVLILVFPFTLGMMLFGDELFSWIFGVEWLNAGKIVQIMMLVFVCLFLQRILSSLLDVFEKQRERLALDVAILVARGSALFGVALYGGSEFDGVWALAISSIIIYVVYFKYILGLVSFSYMDFLHVCKWKVLFIMPLVIGFVGINEFLRLDGVWLMLAIALAVSVEYIFLVLSDKKLRAYARKLIPGGVTA